MKKIFKILFAFAIIALYSCSDDTNTDKSQPKLDLSSKVMKVEKLELIIRKIDAYKKDSENRRHRPDIEEEEEMAEILQPLVDNGAVIHAEMINFLSEQGALDNLSINEREELTNLEDTQLAELSFEMTRGYTMDPAIKDCVGVALGARGIRDMISNTASLCTAQGAKAAPRLLGSRCMGWTPIAWMIMDFNDCMESVR